MDGKFELCDLFLDLDDVLKEKVFLLQWKHQHKAELFGIVGGVVDGTTAAQTTSGAPWGGAFSSQALQRQLFPPRPRNSIWGKGSRVEKLVQLKRGVADASENRGWIEPPSASMVV